MNRFLTCLVGAVALFFVIEQCQAQGEKKFRCFKCNSYFDKGCADYFQNETYATEECEPGVKMCRKIVQEVYYNDQWNVRYIRECAASGEVGDDEGRQCLERTGTYRVKMRYCHCDNQWGCNGAESVSVPMIMMILPALTTIGMLFKRL